ncbi:MAG: hypothetical protein AABN95_13165 [Acidobacteriota bacterium]
MIPKITLSILVLLSMTGLLFNRSKEVDACPSGARVLEIGEFHGKEVDAQTGEKWLGLHISSDGSMLLNYQVTVEAFHDSIVDEPEKKTGKKVSVDLPLEPVFLVEAEGLNAGQVKTVFQGSHENALERTSPVTLKLADISYELKVVSPEGVENCSDEKLPKNAKLVLASAESTQTLYSLEDCGNDPRWLLLWAGDLDGDGRLDLYISVNQHYNVSEKKLFLSSKAIEGRLVVEVAEFVTSGC